MSSLTLLSQPNPENIVILRALHIGDLLGAVPAFRALRAALPDAHITLVGLPWARSFVKRFNNYLNNFITFPGFPGLPEQYPDIVQFPTFITEMQKINFDLAIQLQGAGGIVNSMIRLWGAKKYAGFYLPGEYCPDKNRFLLYPKYEPEVWRHLRLMEFLGIPLQGDELEFPLFENDWKGFQQIKEKYNLQNNYVCLNPGAHSIDRRWPPSHFSSVADGLVALGYQVILTGSEEDIVLTATVARKMKSQAIDLAGKTSLGTLAALISRAQLVVSNDTSISYIASSVKTPSVVLFTVSDPNRWTSQNKKLLRPVTHAMTRTPAEVLDHVESHLQEVHNHVS